MTPKYPSKLDVIFADRNRLPPWLASVHRLATGVPTHAEPTRDWTPAGAFVRNLGWLAIFVAMAFAGVEMAALSPWLAGPGGLIALVGACGVVGRLRRATVGDTHEAGHGIVAKWYQARGWRRRDARRLAEIILDLGSALTLGLNGQAYRRVHGRHHDQRLGTIRDPEGATLAAWGFWPGRLRHGLLLRVVLTLADPRWHLRVLTERLTSNLLEGRIYRRALGLAVMVALLAPLAVLSPLGWAMAIGLPWTVGYQIATALQILTEHPYGYAASANTDAAYAERTWERFPYRPLPPEGARSLAWLTWSLAMTGHLLTRLTILDETMIFHGHHHRAWPLGCPFFDWWNTGHRYVAWRAASPHHEERAVWGLSEALRRQSEGMRRRETEQI